MRHLLSAGALDRDEALLILDTAEALARISDRPVKKLPTLRGRTVVNLFFEDSTRTRISFEAAAKRLSADVINFSAKGSSVGKGESLKDTAMTLEAMGADAVVVRHGASGAPHRLAHSGWIGGHVINAGDGTHEHPTQALLDAFTMRRRLAAGTGDLHGLRVAIVGDVLHSRVARSNVLLLRTLGAEVTVVAPPTLLPVGVGDWPCQTSYDLDSVLPDSDVVMMLRVQAERMHSAFFPTTREYSRRYGLDAAAGGHPARRRDRDAPGPDDPGDGDRPRGRGLRPVDDRGTGHQRSERADGGALPPARRCGHRRPVARCRTRNRGGQCVSMQGEPNRLLLKGIRPYDEEPVDLLIVDGVIAEVGGRISAADAEVIDGDGLVALPGLVDLHTHLREPGREDAETVETGSRSAALGGYTAVHAMANTDPVADTAGVVEQVWRLGREAGLVDVVPVGAVTVGLAGEQLAELGAMADCAARVRVFSDDGNCVSDAVLMRRALEYVKAFDGVIAQHAQEPRLTEGAQMNEGVRSAVLGLRGWPAVAEEAIIARDVLLAQHVDSRLHICHVSTAGSVEILRWAKSRGARVTAEVTPHHLLLTDELAETYDPMFKVNPPLRTEEDVAALRAGLADGTIDIVATDHAPHTAEAKDCEWDVASPGMVGLQSALPVVLETMHRTGALDWRGVADRMSVTPARIGRLDGHGQDLVAGAPANVVLVDATAMVTVDPAALVSRSRNTPFAGRTLPGRIVATILRGQPTVLDGKVQR